MKRRVMHLIATNFYGGPEKQIVEHLVRLNKSETYKGVLCSFLEGGQPNQILNVARQRGIETFAVPMNGPLDVRALMQVYRLLKRQGIDLLVGHHYKAVIFGVIAGRLLGIPVLNYSRGFTAENKRVAFYEKLERLFVRGTKGIISVSEGQREKLQRFGIRKKNMWVVHNGVEVNNEIEKPLRSKIEVFGQFDIPENALLAISVGRLSPEKGHRFLIEAMKLLEEELDNIYFLFCGEGVCTPNLQHQASEYSVHFHCRFAGFQTDMSSIYNACDFLVLPSLTEGLPNVVLEAFAHKKPVVATSVGGVPEVVDDGLNGFLVPSEDAAALAEAIRRLIRNDEIRRKMGEAGYQKIIRHFTFESQTPKLIRIYDSILNNEIQ